ncbi:MAG: 23S rRNA (adenine(2503)-C(2))-methyltransferase RlmN [Rhodospirillaceae bacterium]|nr:23S rRNA (adenine(2503)-C(2))-methyltransferase RlmN [Rhodospirillaceae bacterium]|tara:strand:- start:791 stop:1969 length:1179 start_codon:yes stop_codon:yes gene_type:complete
MVKNQNSTDIEQGPISNLGPTASLIGMDKNELCQLLVEMGESSYRGEQVFRAIYNRGTQNINEITNFSSELREKLGLKYNLFRPTKTSEQISIDGTVKWLNKFEDGNEAETVFIPEDDRGTLCISSQVGCTLTCRFCYTGTQRLVRNLSVGEIVAQILSARDSLNNWPSTIHPRSVITNIVLMGMGEPLYNFDAVARAMKIVMAEDGLSIGKRKITLSTSGVVPKIKECGEKLGVNLAVSLHAANDETRSKIMPINNKYPLRELMEACKNYPGLSNSRRITFEYVMLQGINDSLEDASDLIQLVRDIPCKFNLIPFNPWPGSIHQSSTRSTTNTFQNALAEAGITCPIRAPRGRDILAACGQLKTSSIKVSGKERKALIEKNWKDKEILAEQ